MVFYNCLKGKEICALIIFSGASFYFETFNTVITNPVSIKSNGKGLDLSSFTAI